MRTQQEGDAYLLEAKEEQSEQQIEVVHSKKENDFLQDLMQEMKSFRIATISPETLLENQIKIAQEQRKSCSKSNNMQRSQKRQLQPKFSANVARQQQKTNLTKNPYTIVQLRAEFDHNIQKWLIFHKLMKQNESKYLRISSILKKKQITKKNLLQIKNTLFAISHNYQLNQEAAQQLKQIWKLFLKENEKFKTRRRGVLYFQRQIKEEIEIQNELHENKSKREKLCQKKIDKEIQKDKNKNCQGSKISESKMVTHTTIENTNKMIYTSQQMNSFDLQQLLSKMIEHQNNLMEIHKQQIKYLKHFLKKSEEATITLEQNPQMRNFKKKND